MQIDKLNALWANFGDVPTNNNDEIEAQFLHFPIGTHREEIWRWFESQNSAFLVGEMLFRRARTANETRKEYWAWIDTGELKPLGPCVDFSEADSRAPGNTHWIFDLAGLTELKERITQQLN